MIISGGMAPGIYFNLPAKIYHEDPALSRSNVVALNDTPFTYWDQSWMNPNKKLRKPSDEMEFGEAFHCQMFEPEKFEKQYFVFPTEKWDNGRQMIAKDDHDMIVEAIKVLRAGKDSRRVLTGGMSEVTIVFDAFGMRFRVRIDYLTPVMIVDFKTIYSLFMGVIKKHFEIYGYDVQTYLYKLAITRFKAQFMEGEAHVFGQVDEAWFDMFMRSDFNEFVFVFQRKSAPWPYEVLAPVRDVEEFGMDKTLRAIEVYKKNIAKYGTNPWEVSDGIIKEFSMQFGFIKED